MTTSDHSADTSGSTHEEITSVCLIMTRITLNNWDGSKGKATKLITRDSSRNSGCYGGSAISSKVNSTNYPCWWEMAVCPLLSAPTMRSHILMATTIRASVATIAVSSVDAKPGPDLSSRSHPVLRHNHLHLLPG